MLIVVATVTVMPGHRNEYIALFKEKVPAVLKERGCIEYIPAIDTKTGLSFQDKNDNVVTIIEKWESLEDLKNHGSTEHMKENWQKTKHLVVSQNFKFLEVE